MNVIEKYFDKMHEYVDRYYDVREFDDLSEDIAGIFEDMYSAITDDFTKTSDDLISKFTKEYNAHENYTMSKSQDLRFIEITISRIMNNLEYLPEFVDDFVRNYGGRYPYYMDYEKQNMIMSIKSYIDILEKSYILKVNTVDNLIKEFENLILAIENDDVNIYLHSY